MTEDEGFIRRWARRKDLAAREEREERAPPPAENAVRERDDGSEATAPQRVAVEDLPDIESMSVDSDFSPFLQAGVPEDLRNAALRRLWTLDPVFANLDGLLEYGEDYTDAATVVENLKTAYRVGRGFAGDDETMAEPGEAAEADADPARAEAESEVAPNDVANNSEERKEEQIMHKNAKDNKPTTS